MKSYQVIGLLFLGIFLYLLISFGVMGCWNEGISPAFGLPQIGYSNALHLTGFASIISLLFSKPSFHQKKEQDQE